MGKPRLIILIRHGQSEGNRNRNIHQFIADHRIPLTPEGWVQAEDAGRRLKALLRKDDTIRIFTSPYRRTRETTEGILRTLAADDDAGSPSPFQRESIKVYEEPRLREQDFGNFQPCSIEMERMWQERADYGHFFYRIPNGESAADAYDRVSGFNESLWRQFGDETFPSVCILVTHGLMTRIFLMKWFKYSVEYFEDLRNIRHCEFVIMERNENAKYELKSALRTWSELQRGKDTTSAPATPKPPARQWGGCVDGCNHRFNFPRRTQRVNTKESLPAAGSTEYDDHPIACQDLQNGIGEPPARTTSVKKLSAKTVLHDFELNPTDGGVALPHMHELVVPGAEQAEDDDDDDDDDEDEGGDQDAPGHAQDDEDEGADGDEIDVAHHQLLHRRPSTVVDEDDGDPDAAGNAGFNGSGLLLAPFRHGAASELALRGRDGGGSTSGVASPAGLSDDGDYFGGDAGGVAVGQQDQQQPARPAAKSTPPRVSFQADNSPSSTETASPALRNGDAAAPVAAGGGGQHHACTACGRPFEHDSVAAPAAVATDSAGSLPEGTAREDVY